MSGTYITVIFFLLDQITHQLVSQRVGRSGLFKMGLRVKDGHPRTLGSRERTRGQALWADGNNQCVYFVYVGSYANGCVDGL